MFTDPPFEVIRQQYGNDSVDMRLDINVRHIVDLADRVEHGLRQRELHR